MSTLATSASIATRLTATLALASTALAAPALAQSSTPIEGIAPVELAVVDHSPVTCEPDPLILPSNSVVELHLINNSINSTVINLDPLLIEQMVLEGNDMAPGAVAEMQDGFLLGPGQERTLTIATLESGSFETACRSPVAGEGRELVEGLNDFGVVRVE
ncbi:MAG: hypothetical protein JJ908_02080 [Rhizobiales bacterium]|nr:hypothetical protein [Hyphomicrobiales bacterium]MBO6698609.1 hypothetical protein [Hyphomicrobiales bacterium]MBO6735138.1 hypothetical protein [Hyphomicrobiales bacterium]MBO6911055.1 hypothetical protein [Hyphomicrobiales bacterium]MBO6956434.1 hypothetical protein [Hyphomicrobiales bacterium]